MFRAVYVDESGSGTKDHGLMILAGYVSTTARWKRFVDAWSKVLRDYEVQEIHMKPLWDGEGDFDNSKMHWEKRKNLIRRCDSIIQRHVEVGFRISVRVEEYNEIARGNMFDEDGKPTAKGDHPWYLLFMSLVGALHRLPVIREKNNEIALFFDDKDEFATMAQADFVEFKKMLAQVGLGKFVGPCFDDSKKLLPLQAADMLAWGEHRRITHPDFEWPGKPRPDGFVEEVHFGRRALKDYVERSKKGVQRTLEKRKLRQSQS